MLTSTVTAVPLQTQAQEGMLRVELNAVATVQARCRVSFVVENKSANALETFKLDLAIFNQEGVIQNQLVVELGPLRRAKTVVKAFELDGECGQVGSILVNEVAACAPLEPAACLDQLTLSSRPKGIRFYK
jgi:hypothetical protein